MVIRNNGVDMESTVPVPVLVCVVPALGCRDEDAVKRKGREGTRRIWLMGGQALKVQGSR